MSAATRTPDVTITAYRVRGGAVVKVTRNGRTRRYRVGCARFRRLSHALSCTPRAQQWSGYFGRSSLDARRWPA